MRTARIFHVGTKVRVKAILDTPKGDPMFDTVGQVGVVQSISHLYHEVRLEWDHPWLNTAHYRADELESAEVLH